MSNIPGGRLESYSMGFITKRGEIIPSWNTIDASTWSKVEKKVHRIQYRIFVASRSNKKVLVHWLQRRLVNSLEARLLAVRRTTILARGRLTEGTDGKVITTNKERLQLAVEGLTLDGKSSSIRRVWIPKPGKKEKRPLGIPTIRDRAKQALALLALEPEWEAKFEPNSFGFRPGRSSQDAIEAIFANLRVRNDRTKWVFDADIKKCFDKISHEALLTKLETYPAMKKQIRSWLKAGILDYRSVPKFSLPTEGTPQGGVISPLLANIALHGLENHLKDYVASVPGLPYPGANRGIKPKREALGIVRYADDFVVTHTNLEILKECMVETEKFLSTVGLTISEEKSKLRKASEGFNFLGFHIVQIKNKQSGYRVKIYPAEKNQLSLLEKTRRIIGQSKSVPARLLIKRLAATTIGWANYFKYCECSLVFRKLDHQIWGQLRAWVFRTSTRKSRTELVLRYFPKGETWTYLGKEHKDNWVFAAKQEKNKKKPWVFLPKLSWVPSSKFVKVIDDKSPLDGDYAYWIERSSKFGKLRHYVLMKKQKGICTWCGQRFQHFSTVEVDHIIPRALKGKDIYANLQLLHKHCHKVKTEIDVKTMRSLELMKQRKLRGRTAESETRTYTSRKKKQDVRTTNGESKIKTIDSSVQ